MATWKAINPVQKPSSISKICAKMRITRF
jgi:hypothetical protein